MKNQIVLGDCLPIMTAMKPRSVRLVITSPPYPGKLGRYGGKGKLNDEEWVAWMLPRLLAMLRVCSGMVGIVANSRVSEGSYRPAVEALIVDAWRAGIVCERPVVWHKNSPPNRKDWFGNDHEHVIFFRNEDCKRVWNWEAIGTPPKYSAGGRFRQRTSNGTRRLGNSYPKNKLARPRDVIRVTVGGGHLGSKLAHDNEAPFPEALVEPFVLALSNPGDVVLDPFCGSGTTLKVAAKHGRSYIGIDDRDSQVELSGRRVLEVAK